MNPRPFLVVEHRRGTVSRMFAHKRIESISGCSLFSPLHPIICASYISIYAICVHLPGTHLRVIYSNQLPGARRPRSRECSQRPSAGMIPLPRATKLGYAMTLGKKDGQYIAVAGFTARIIAPGPTYHWYPRAAWPPHRSLQELKESRINL